LALAVQVQQHKGMSGKTETLLALDRFTHRAVVGLVLIMVFQTLVMAAQPELSKQEKFIWLRRPIRLQ
jgi:hypothetical protein